MQPQNVVNLGLPLIIDGLASDLQALRDGQISVNDAIARATLAKQIFNGVRLYLNGSAFLATDIAEPKQIGTNK